MGQPELVHELAVGVRLLDGVQVGSLEVLDERQLELFASGRLPDDGRDARQAGELRSPDPTLARDQAIAFERLRHEHRLQDAVRHDARAELVQLVYLEHGSRLVRIPLDALDRDVRRNGRRGGGPGNQRVEAAAKRRRPRHQATPPDAPAPASSDRCGRGTVIDGDASDMRGVVADRASWSSRASSSVASAR